MNEIIPIAAGALIGIFLVPRIPARRRSAALVLLSLVFGTAASWISAELGKSWAYLAIDVLEVGLAGSAAWFLAGLWRVRRTVAKPS